MKHLGAAILTEVMKIRGSKVFWLTLLFFAFVPLMMGLLMFVQMYPEISGKLGMIGTKASLLRFGEPNWTSFFTLFNESSAAVGYVGFGFITTWIFGREFTDHTGKDLMALPVSRAAIVNAKFLVVLLWSLLLSIDFYLVGLLAGKVIHLSGWSGKLILDNMGTFTLSSLLTLSLCTVIAFLASYGRGFLLPLGIVILTMIMANFTGMVGLGPYFPWSIPGILSTGSSNPEMQLRTASYLILTITSVAGYFATRVWWQHADQK